MCPSLAAEAASQTAVSTSDVQRHYDVMSLPYRLFWGEHLHHGLFLTGHERPEQAQIQLLDYCAVLADVRLGSSVLDVGCGYGATAVYLAQKFNCAVLGLTLSPNQAQVARERICRLRLEHRVHISICDVEQIQLGGKHDFIWTIECSEHVHNKRAYIEKVTRVLADGGRFLLAAWTGSMHHRFLRELAGRTVCPGFQTASDYAAQMRSAGLKILAIDEITRFVVPTWEICWRRVLWTQLLWPLLPAHLRRFLDAIPMMSEAYRRGLLAYTIIVGEKQT